MSTARSIAPVGPNLIGCLDADVLAALDCADRKLPCCAALSLDGPSDPKFRVASQVRSFNDTPRMTGTSNFLD
jgi:hypothetical protein